MTEPKPIVFLKPKKVEIRESPNLGDVIVGITDAAGKYHCVLIQSESVACVSNPPTKKK